MPRVSIIMPLYNSADYLKEAINSILNQTFTDWEFIIINEYQSDDGSAEIVQEYARADHRFVWIQNEQHLGISESMNRGIEAAQGEYLARMDADDISLPDRLKKQITYMDQHPEIAMCGVMAEIFGSNSFVWELETDTQKLATNILFYSPSIHPTVMIRKSFLDQYGIRYCAKYRASEDYDLFSQICRYGKIANLEENLFCYRIMEHNATFKNNDIGLRIYRKVMERQFIRLGLAFSEPEIQLLSPHGSIRDLSGKAVYYAIEKAELLLQKIFVANEKKKIYDRQYLWMTLRKRFLEICDSCRWLCSGYDEQEVEKIKKHSIFRNEKFYEKTEQKEKRTGPLVSVLMPVYHSEDYILGALWSILEQTYQNFEVLVINEAGTQDDTVFLTSIFEDERIRVIQNQTRLGLAESLNLGIREAKGVYLARMDADDLCVPKRFELQVDFLEKNPAYGICGAWQHHFGIGKDWTHKCSVSFRDIQAELLFNCDLCHSLLMLRRACFIKNQLYYNPAYAAEDYELWTRAVKLFKIANLPYVLGEYRVGDTNLTAKKMKRLSWESGRLAAENIAYYFGIQLPQHLVPLQSGWKNEFEKLRPADRKKALKEQERLFRKIWNVNQKQQKLDSRSLLKTINKKWRWITNTWEEDGKIYQMDELFRTFQYNRRNPIFYPVRDGKLQIRNMAKMMLRKPYDFLKSHTMDVLQQHIWDMDGHLWDYYQKILQEIQKQERTENKQKAVLKKDIHNIVRECLRDLQGRIQEAEKQQEQRFDDRLQQAQEHMFQRISGGIQKAQEQTDQWINDRMQQAEKQINEVTDTRIWKAQQQVNEVMDARVWKAESHIVELQKILAKLVSEFQAPGKKVILINTPATCNLGDHAIAYAEKCWIKEHLCTCMIELDGEFYRKHHEMIKDFIKEDDILALSGGGYIGSLWPYEEELAEQVISDYPENKICIFPQTIYYEDHQDGRQILERSRQIFEHHKDLTIFVRETESLQFAKEMLPKCKVIPASDMVLYFLVNGHFPLREHVEKNGVAFCLKDDKESILTTEEKEEIAQDLTKTGKELFFTDTMLENRIEPAFRYSAIHKKLEEFQSYEYVITDRFHGIVFSILAGTKCIALNGASYKNRGLCRMLAGTGSVVFTESIKDLTGQLKDTLFLESRIELDQFREMLIGQFADMEAYF